VKTFDNIPYEGPAEHVIGFSGIIIAGHDAEFCDPVVA